MKELKNVLKSTSRFSDDEAAQVVRNIYASPPEEIANYTIGLTKSLLGQGKRFDDYLTVASNTSVFKNVENGALRARNNAAIAAERLKFPNNTSRQFMTANNFDADTAAKNIQEAHYRMGLWERPKVSLSYESYPDRVVKSKRINTQRQQRQQEELDRYTSRNLLDEQAAREERIAEGLEKSPAQKAAEEQAELERLATLKDAQYNDPSVQEAWRRAERGPIVGTDFANTTGQVRDKLSLEQKKQVDNFIQDREQQQAIDRDRQNVAILMNESPDSDAVIAATNNIRQNSPLGSVVLENSVRPLRQAAEQKQAALNLFNTDVKNQKQILKEYFNNTGTKEDTFNKIFEDANITDDEITKRAIERSSDKKTQEEFLDKIKATRQFANDPTIENFKNIGIKAPDDAAQDFVENFQRYKALKQEDEIRQKISNGSWGSGKTLQEAAGSAQDQAVASAASDFSSAFPSFEKAMSGDGNVSLDRAILRSKMGGDPSDWGFEGGSNHLLTNQEKGFNKFIKDLRKSNASPEEKQKLFNDKVFEIQKNIAEGPGMSDFFFGNQLHTGAIGAAAIMGTMGIAFGGRKSNAELYSSPF